MNVDIYKSTTNKRKHLAVEHNSLITSGSSRNYEQDNDYVSIELVSSNVALVKGIIGINPVIAEADIKTKGYHLFEAIIKIS